MTERSDAAIKPADFQRMATGLVTLAVLVAALGYFVDLFDILLFSVVRVASLKSLGFEGKILTDNGIFLLNMQMTGLLTGGILWGIAGDKKGRLTVLFGSIFLYSIANIANGFVHSIGLYALCRFTAGFGLAGELGAGITLVAEIMPKGKRGYATTIVTGVGVCGAVTAFLISKYFDWRTAYFIGGGLGIVLLLLRIGVAESGMFNKIKGDELTKRGDFISLFTNKERFFKYIRCIAIGVPSWYMVGILITLSPEFGKVLHIQGEVNAGTAVACCYGGTLLGDLISGLISQYLKSRVKALFIFLVLSLLSVVLFFSLHGISLTAFYYVCFLVGISNGYIVIFLTMSTEQFGTNIRATVTTTVPNFVRGSLILLTAIFQFLTHLFKDSIIIAGILLGVLCLGLAFLSLSKTEETFSKDLDYLE